MHVLIDPGTFVLLIRSPLELQQEQPQLYDNLTKILNPEEQQIVQAVIVQADANAVAAQAVAAATATQANGGH